MPGYEIGSFLRDGWRLLLREMSAAWGIFPALVAQVDPSKDLQVQTAQHGMREGFVVAPKWKGKGEGQGART